MSALQSRDDIYRVWQHRCPGGLADVVVLPIGDTCLGCGTSTSISGGRVMEEYLAADLEYASWNARLAARTELRVPALNEALRQILGRPNFSCAALAQILRLNGVQIAHRAEDEQATVIHYLLTMYAHHGESWSVAVGEDLAAIVKRAEERGELR